MKKFNIKTIKENKNVEELKQLYQEKTLRLQLLQQFLQQIQSNLEQLNNTFVELNNLKDNVESLNENEKDKESIIQLYQGIFLKAKILSLNNFIVGVGKNVLVEKDKDELLKFLDVQIEDAKNNFESLNLQYEDLKKEYVSLYEELRQLEVELNN